MLLQRSLRLQCSNAPEMSSESTTSAAQSPQFLMPRIPLPPKTKADNRRPPAAQELSALSAAVSSPPAALPLLTSTVSRPMRRSNRLSYLRASSVVEDDSESTTVPLTDVSSIALPSPFLPPAPYLATEVAAAASPDLMANRWSTLLPRDTENCQANTKLSRRVSNRVVLNNNQPFKDITNVQANQNIFCNKSDSKDLDKDFTILNKTSNLIEDKKYYDTKPNISEDTFIFDPSLLSFEPPRKTVPLKKRATVDRPTGLRRSTRICAMEATLRNRTLLCATPEKQTRRRISKAPKKDTTILYNIAKPCLAVSPGVLRRHSDEASILAVRCATYD